MAGIERSLSMIQKDGEEMFSKYAEMLTKFRQSVSDLQYLRVMDKGDFTKEEIYDYDMGKILIETGQRMSGQELSEILRSNYGLQMEMASGSYVVAMTSVMDRQEGFDRLSEALHLIDRTLEGVSEKPVPAPGEIYQELQKVQEIWEAEEDEQETVAVTQAAGRVSADYVYLYPPGIPIIVPWERILQHTVHVITESMRLGLDVEGLQNFERINVVKK